MGFKDFIKGVVSKAQGAEGQTLADGQAGNAALFTEAIAALIETNEHHFVTIEDAEATCCLQVAKSPQTLTLNIASYPFDEFPLHKLPDLGIDLPEGVTLSNWEAGSFAELDVPVEAHAELAATIDSIFRQGFNCPDGYHVSIYMEA